MFSLGCLFYYVLSEGKHPFGEPLRRQANILSGEYELGDLKGETCQIELARMLISKLICANAEERPPANVVYIYPLFWSQSRILIFLQVCLFNEISVNETVISFNIQYRNIILQT